MRQQILVGNISALKNLNLFRAPCFEFRIYKISMLRTLSLSIAVFLLLAGTLPAQDAWPAFSTGLPDPNAIARGPGFYAAIWKLVMLVALVWLWVKSAGWVGT